MVFTKILQLGNHHFSRLICDRTRRSLSRSIPLWVSGLEQQRNLISCKSREMTPRRRHSGNDRRMATAVSCKWTANLPTVNGYGRRIAQRANMLLPENQYVLGKEGDEEGVERRNERGDMDPQLSKY